MYLYICRKICTLKADCYLKFVREAHTQIYVYIYHYSDSHLDYLVDDVLYIMSSFLPINQILCIYMKRISTLIDIFSMLSALSL